VTYYAHFGVFAYSVGAQGLFSTLLEFPEVSFPHRPTTMKSTSRIPSKERSLAVPYGREAKTGQRRYPLHISPSARPPQIDRRRIHHTQESLPKYAGKFTCSRAIQRHEKAENKHFFPTYRLIDQRTTARRALVSLFPTAFTTK
jgi:hypothetical protein